MNQGKLEAVRQEIVRVNIYILGINELKCTGMGEFNSDAYYIYYCGQKQDWELTVAQIMNCLLPIQLKLKKAGNQ